MPQSKTLISFLPPIAWMVVIFLISSRPDLPKNQIIVLDFLAKKTAHVIEYFILCLLWNRSLGTKYLTTSILISLFYAFTDEIHQLFVPGRGGLLRDVAIDSLGIFAASYLIIKNSSGKNLRLNLN